MRRPQVSLLTLGILLDGYPLHSGGHNTQCGPPELDPRDHKMQVFPESNGYPPRTKPACHRFSTKTVELSSRCSHCAKIRAASSGPMRGIFCLFRPRFPDVVSGILIPLSRRPGWFRVVRPRELPELWTAHYKGQQICGFCGLRSDPDNATVRRGRTTSEADTADSERLAG